MVERFFSNCHLQRFPEVKLFITLLKECSPSVYLKEKSAKFNFKEMMQHKIYYSGRISLEGSRIIQCSLDIKTALESPKEIQYRILPKGNLLETTSRRFNNEIITGDIIIIRGPSKLILEIDHIKVLHSKYSEIIMHRYRILKHVRYLFFIIELHTINSSI